MASRENLPYGHARFVLSQPEQIQLVHIIEKISRDKSLTELWQYKLARQFAQLFSHDQRTMERDIMGDPYTTSTTTPDET